MSAALVTVFGATGRQGGGVVSALLADPRRRFRVRAVTRRPASPRARALQRAGAELFAADCDDPRSLAEALEGAHGAYCTAPWSGPDAVARATARAHAMAHAAAHAGVAHVVWSTFEDARDFAGGVPAARSGCGSASPFDVRGEANRAFRELRVPTTLFYGSPHWEDVVRDGLRERADGTLVLRLPLGTALLPGIAVADEGACAAALFAIGEEAIGRAVGVAAEHLAGPRMAEHIARALGRCVVHAPAVPDDAERARAYRFMHDHAPSFCAVRSVACTRELHPQVRDFAAWLAHVRHRLPHVRAEVAL